MNKQSVCVPEGHSSQWLTLYRNNDTVKCKYWLQLHFIWQMARNIFHKLKHLSCSWWLMSVNAILYCSCMFSRMWNQERFSAKKSDLCSVCEWTSGILVMQPHLSSPAHTFIPRCPLTSPHKTLMSWILEWQAAGHSTALLWRQYCTCVSTICLFYSLVFLYDSPLVILHKDDVLLWTNGVVLCVQLSVGFSSHVALEVSRF